MFKSFGIHTVTTQIKTNEKKKENEQEANSRRCQKDA
jgi:hypothetical protein